MKILILLFISLLFFQSCSDEIKERNELTQEEARKRQEEIDFSRKVIGAEVRKGMYTYNANTSHFIECGTNKKFILVGEYETNEIKKAYQDKRNVNPTGFAYLEIEAFPSMKDIDGNKIEDSVLVVTRFIRFDSGKDCD